MIPGEILIWQLIIHAWQLNAKQFNSPAGTVSIRYCSLERMTLIFFFLCGLRSYQVSSSATQRVKVNTGSQSLSKLPYFLPSPITVFSPCLWWYAATTPWAFESWAAPQDPGSSTASWCCTPLQDNRPDSPSCIPSPLEARRLSVPNRKKKKKKKKRLKLSQCPAGLSRYNVYTSNIIPISQLIQISSQNQQARGDTYLTVTVTYFVMWTFRKSLIKWYY